MSDQRPATGGLRPATGDRPRIVAIVGPTASGKTSLALPLAQAFGAEIVGADSRQVYRRLDIGSAKASAAERRAVRHHLVDVVEPDAHFDCARYRALAAAAIDDITRRGKRVLVVGGTGLYLKVLRGGLFPGPPGNTALRARLRRDEESDPGSLHRRLAAVDPSAAARLHRRDLLRLIRALEVYELTGCPIGDWQAEHGFAAADYEMLILGIAVERAELYARIDRRCVEMIDAGLVDEVRGLFAAGFDAALPALRSPGYREIGEMVRGACELPEAVSRMAQATRRLAKRQLTWFRRDPAVTWCPANPHILREHMQGFWNCEARPL